MHSIHPFDDAHELNEVNELNEVSELNAMGDHAAQTVGKLHIQMTGGTHRAGNAQRTGHTHRGQEAHTEDRGHRMERESMRNTQWAGGTRTPGT